MPITIDIVDLPDYVGLDRADSQAAIEAQGLRVVVAYAHDDVVEAGLVSAQTVATDGPDHIVVLTESLGPGADNLGRGLVIGRVRRPTLRVRYTP